MKSLENKTPLASVNLKRWMLSTYWLLFPLQTPFFFCVCVGVFQVNVITCLLCLLDCRFYEHRVIVSGHERVGQQQGLRLILFFCYSVLLPVIKVQHCPFFFLFLFLVSNSTMLTESLEVKTFRGFYYNFNLWNIKITVLLLKILLILCE